MVEQRPFKPKVVGSIPTAPTKLLHSSRLIFEVNNNLPFNNNSIHTVSLNTFGTTRHSVTLLCADGVPIDSQRDSRIAVP